MTELIDAILSLAIISLIVYGWVEKLSKKEGKRCFNDEPWFWLIKGILWAAMAPVSYLLSRVGFALMSITFAIINMLIATAKAKKDEEGKKNV